VLDLACTALRIATAPAAGPTGQPSPLDMPPVPGGLDAVAARSSSSAVAVGATVPTPPHSRALVAVWDGAVWTTLSNRTLPPESDLGAVALFPGGAWAVGEKRMSEHGRVFHPLIVRVTGSTVRQVPVPVRSYSSALRGAAATSAADAWAVGSTYNFPLILHWNGRAWTRARLPATVKRGVFTGVAATSRTNAWAVGYDRSKKGGPLIVHWNGTAWTRVWLPATVATGSQTWPPPQPRMSGSSGPRSCTGMAGSGRALSCLKSTARAISLPSARHRRAMPGLWAILALAPESWRCTGTGIAGRRS